jgi:hypothetical protein
VIHSRNEALSRAYAINGAGASVWDYPTRADAEQTALDYCGYTSCKVLSTFKDCGAVAFDGSNLQGGYGPTLSSAIADAKSRLPGGSIDSWACNQVLAATVIPTTRGTLLLPPRSQWGLASLRPPHAGSGSDGCSCGTT